MGPPAVKRYNKYTSLWRKAVSMYYAIPTHSANEVLMCATYGYPAPRNEISESRDSVLFLEWLAFNVGRVRIGICNDTPNTYQYFTETARQNPSGTTFFYYVYGKEGEILSS